jgi:hypothetical protein
VRAAFADSAAMQGRKGNINLTLHPHRSR